LSPQTIKADWLMLTVPHSGTRYVYGAFNDAGAVSYQYKFRGKFDAGGRPILRWGHFWSDREEPLREACDQIENRFVVLRNPINTLASHYLDPEPIGVKKTHLGGSWQQLIDFSKEYKFKYFNLERDGLDAISEWAGITLDPKSHAYSRGRYPLKDAIEDKDLDRVLELLDDERGKELLNYFYLYGKSLWPLYEANGYDIWWS
jgi:hypothetical protein